jgi:hypothetical protein
MKTFTEDEVRLIVDFMTDYNDKNINSEHILDKYGIDVEHLNTREALDTYLNHIEETGGIDAKELWGADLYAVFHHHIDKKGWLTSDWATIIENTVPRFDKNYNDNPLYSETYSRMYNLEFEDSEDKSMIRPLTLL